MNNSSIMIPMVSSEASATDRTLRILALLIFPAAYVVGWQLFDLIVRSW